MQSQVQQNSREGSGEGLGGFGAEPGQVGKVPETVPETVWEDLVQSQIRFKRRSGRLPRSGSTGFRRRFRREALVQVRFNRVPEKVPKKVPEKVLEKVLGALVQSQVRFNRVRRRFGRLWCRARSGSTGFAAI